VIGKVMEMRDKGLRVAIFSNSADYDFASLPGIRVVLAAHAKPDPRGFVRAMEKHLELDDPWQVCMIGDNYLTDGAANAAGMRFIYVDPIRGKEGIVHRATRYYSLMCARIYHGDPFKS